MPLRKRTGTPDVVVGVPSVQPPSGSCVGVPGWTMAQVSGIARSSRRRKRVMRSGGKKGATIELHEPHWLHGRSHMHTAVIRLAIADAARARDGAVHAVRRLPRLRAPQ